MTAPITNTEAAEAMPWADMVLVEETGAHPLLSVRITAADMSVGAGGSVVVTISTQGPKAREYARAALAGLMDAAAAQRAS